MCDEDSDAGMSSVYSSPMLRIIEFTNMHGLFKPRTTRIECVILISRWCFRIYIHVFKQSFHHFTTSYTDLYQSIDHVDEELKPSSKVLLWQVEFRRLPLQSIPHTRYLERLSLATCAHIKFCNIFNFILYL